MTAAATTTAAGTPGDRAASAPSAPTANGGEPTLEFADSVPYDAYVHASTLHRLQQPLSKDPGEMSFLMISQVMELYFGLVRFELRETQRLLREDDVWGALAPLRRTALHLEGLNAAWHGAALDDPGRLQPLPRPARRGLRVPVGDVPAPGVPARPQDRVAGPPVPAPGRGVPTSCWRR